MIFTSLIFFAVSDRGDLCQSAFVHSLSPEERTNIGTVSSLTHPTRKVLTHEDAKTAVNSDSLISIAQPRRKCNRIFLEKPYLFGHLHKFPVGSGAGEKIQDLFHRLLRL